MARQAASYRTTGIGSATLPTASLYAGANGALWLVEVGITNTSVTMFEISLCRLSSAGTSTAKTGTYEESDVGFTASGTARDVHSGTAPTLGTEIRRASIGASIGSGVIWTFGGRGLFIPSGVANGVGLLPISTAGQLIDVYWSWDA
ncbi:MAG TPA: hypothetical protein VGJ86_13535 [Acidimicrobiales bacterium]